MNVTGEFPMRRFIVTYTSDYYSGGPSVGFGGFVGDFDNLIAAMQSLKGKLHSCSAAEILDTHNRRVMIILEGYMDGVWEALK